MRLLSVRKIKFMFCLIFLTMLISISGYAQTKRITGKITTTEDAKPVVGATVKVKGTATSSVSDINGDYSISAKAGDQLVFSYIGIQSKEVTVTENTSTINVSLTASQSNLNEVVVIGYGKASRKDLTGAISSIKAKDI